MTALDATAFVAALRRRFADPQHPLASSVQWVAGGTSPDGRAVIIYRETRTDGPLLGRRYDLEAFSALFDPSFGVEELADVAFVQDITDPTSGGTVRATDWAVGLVPDTLEIEWVGELYEVEDP